MVRKKKEPVISYKGFNSDWTCRNFKYELGKEYSTKEKIEPCSNGFHACKMPLDIFNYYPPINNNGRLNKFAMVEQDGTIKEDNDKRASSKIKIKTALSIPELFKIEFELIKDTIQKSENTQATTGDWAHSSTTGYRAHSSTTGDWAHSSTTGYMAHSSTTGYRAHSSTTGYRAHSSTTGDWAHSSTTGYMAHSSTTGNEAHSSTTGYMAHSSTTGYRAHSSTTGDWAHSSTTGDWAHSSTTGYRAHSSTTGYRAHSSTTGYRAHSSTTGYMAHSSTTGYMAHSSTTGENSIACALGIESKAKAVNGWLILVDWMQNSNNEWFIKNIFHAKVGSKICDEVIKPDTYYWFENGTLKCEET